MYCLHLTYAASRGICIIASGFSNIIELTSLNAYRISSIPIKLPPYILRYILLRSPI